MKKYIDFLTIHRYVIVIILIIFLASVLRFYNYSNRWGIATDQAHDALVARYALESHEVPLIGPFSSAGPFVMGPEWYYFIMLGTAFYPSSVLTPWIVLTIMYIITVYIMMRIGQELENKPFAIILGLITAVSSVQISQSFNLTNQAPLSILSALALWAILKYLKTKNELYLYISSLSIAIGVNMHLQGVLLIPLLIFTFCVMPPKLKYFIMAVFLFCIPFIPLLIFDFRTNHYEVRNMLQYYLHDQYRISLDQFGRNWKSYIGIFWPNAIAKMIGGIPIVSYAIILTSLVLGARAILQKRITRFGAVFIVTFALSVIVLRYTHTPLFDSYLMFANPFIFIIVGWTIYEIVKKQKIIGNILLFIVLLGSIVVDMQQMQHVTNITAQYASSWKNILYAKYPKDKFAIYDYKYKTSTQSLSLSLFLSADQKINDNGRRIGVLIDTAYKNPNAYLYPRLLPGWGYQIIDLQSSSSAQLLKNNWAFINPKGIYKSAESWYK